MANRESYKKEFIFIIDNEIKNLFPSPFDAAEEILEFLEDEKVVSWDITPQGTWCREHRTYDLCPENCPRCKGYWHGDTDCRYAGYMPK